MVNQELGITNLIINGIKLKDYSYEYYHTELLAGYILLYIINHLCYKPRNGLYIYKSTELELTLIENFNSRKTNVTVGYICRYLHLVKGVRIQSYSGPHFYDIFPYSD